MSDDVKTKETHSIHKEELQFGEELGLELIELDEVEAEIGEFTARYM
jgi:hypothetical protein